MNEQEKNTRNEKMKQRKEKKAINTPDTIQRVNKRQCEREKETSGQEDGTIRKKKQEREKLKTISHTPQLKAKVRNGKAKKREKTERKWE